MSGPASPSTEDRVAAAERGDVDEAAADEKARRMLRLDASSRRCARRCIGRTGDPCLVGGTVLSSDQMPGWPPPLFGRPTPSPTTCSTIASATARIPAALGWKEAGLPIRSPLTHGSALPRT